MSKEQWMNASSFTELCELNRKWISGESKYCPDWGPYSESQNLSPESEPLLNILEKCNRKGFYTSVSQPATPSQKAYVQGLMSKYRAQQFLSQYRDDTDLLITINDGHRVFCNISEKDHKHDDYVLTKITNPVLLLQMVRDICESISKGYNMALSVKGIGPKEIADSILELIEGNTSVGQKEGMAPHVCLHFLNDDKRKEISKDLACISIIDRSFNRQEPYLWQALDTFISLSI